MDPFAWRNHSAELSPFYRFFSVNQGHILALAFTDKFHPFQVTGRWRAGLKLGSYGPTWNSYQTQQDSWMFFPGCFSLLQQTLITKKRICCLGKLLPGIDKINFCENRSWTATIWEFEFKKKGVFKRTFPDPGTTWNTLIAMYRGTACRVLMDARRTQDNVNARIIK